MKDGIEIVETEEGDRYEARALVDGRLIAIKFYRSVLTGFPYDYKARAHREIRQAVAEWRAEHPTTGRQP